MTSRGVTRREAIAAGMVGAAALWSWRTANADAAGSALANGANTSTVPFSAQLGTFRSQPGLLMLGMTGAPAVSSNAATTSSQTKLASSTTTHAPSTLKGAPKRARRPVRPASKTSPSGGRHRRHHRLRVQPGRRASRRSTRRRHRTAQASRRTS
jgi:hypothetical protein